MWEQHGSAKSAHAQHTPSSPRHTLPDSRPWSHQLIVYGLYSVYQKNLNPQKIAINTNLKRDSQKLSKP